MSDLEFRRLLALRAPRKIPAWFEPEFPEAPSGDWDPDAYAEWLDARKAARCGQWPWKYADLILEAENR